MMNVETMFAKNGTYSAAERRAVFAAFRSRDLLEEALQKYQTEKRLLAGHLCFIKDNFDIPGFSTYASSLFLEEVSSGPHPAGKLVQRLETLGLAIAGKTHMNEFAYELDGANPHFGNCPHPQLPGCCSGGSSSGSAWTVAQGLVPIAFGTDTGGSIRVPAAFCGLTGFRLPPDDWAGEGCFPLAPRFDAAGWLTRSVTDMATFTQAMLDLPTASEAPLRNINAVPDHAFLQPAVLARIVRARTWEPSEVLQAEETAKDTVTLFARLFEQAEVLLLPVSLSPAARFPMSQAERTALLMNTVPASLAGLPVLTLPMQSPDGPLGVQCMLPAKGWREILARLLRVA